MSIQSAREIRKPSQSRYAPSGRWSVDRRRRRRFLAGTAPASSRCGGFHELSRRLVVRPGYDDGQPRDRVRIDRHEQPDAHGHLRYARASSTPQRTRQSPIRVHSIWGRDRPGRGSTGDGRRGRRTQIQDGSGRCECRAQDCSSSRVKPGGNRTRSGQRRASDGSARVRARLAIPLRSALT